MNRYRSKHAGGISYSCSLCPKKYSRSDVLARHLQQAHGQKAARVGRPRKMTCIPCSEMKAACDGIPPASCSQCIKADHIRECRYVARRNLRSQSQRPQTREGSQISVQSPARDRSQVTQGEASTNIPQCNTDSPRVVLSGTPKVNGLDGFRDTGDGENPSEGTPREQQTSHWQGSLDTIHLGAATSLPANSADVLSTAFDSASYLPGLFTSTTSQAWLDQDSTAFANNALIPQFNVSFDWGFTDMDSNIFDYVGANQESTPTMNNHSPLNVVVPERDAEIVMALKAEEVDGQPDVEDLPNGSPEENFWPNVYKPQTPDTSIALPETRPNSPLDRVLVGTPTATVNSQARERMKMLATYAHRGVWPLPDFAMFPSATSLTSCINLYLANFANWLPIVDSPRGSFRVDKAAPILLMAMAAVGSVYGHHGLERLASPLNELVRREILYTCEFDQRFVFEPCIVQSSLLQAYFGIYSGSPRLFQLAEVTRASLVASCKRMHLLSSTYSAAKELLKQNPAATLEERRRAVKQDHRNSRLGWSIFLLDAQLACLFGLSSLYPMAEIQVSLPTLAPDTSVLGQPFARVFTNLLDKGILIEQPSDFGLSCIAYTLYRHCLDAASLQQFQARSTDFEKYSLAFPGCNKHPQSLLDQLAVHAFGSLTSLTSLRLSCVALSYHAHLQFTSIGLLDQIKLAAGKSGDPDNRAVAQAEVAARLRDCPARARHIFAHAAMLRCLLNRFTFDTPTEVIWIFDSALCMWACLDLSVSLFSNENEIEGATLPEYTLSWKSPPSLDDWVISGQGRVSVQGMGSGSEINSRDVLRCASQRLDVISWGLAARYRQVLRDLITHAKV